jgi:peptide/nickel transport system substrate-binding protein
VYHSLFRTRIQICLGIVVLLTAIFLGACRPGASTPTDVLTPTPQAMVSPNPQATSTASLPALFPTLAASPVPTLTPTVELPNRRVLTICARSEPQSLFLYQATSTAARSVLQAIYDGPFDVRSYRVQPVILEKIPSLADGDAYFETVTINPGDQMVDAAGRLTTLATGVIYRPSGCNDFGCELVAPGDQSISVDQLVVHFKLKPGLLWSDGAPLTADDSVYSFEVARSLFALGQSSLINQTQSYQALDSLTVEWRGVPGYQEPRYQENFFTPLPRHAWGILPLDQLLVSESATRTPLGWGPYVIDQWVAGDHMTLHKNPHYFRSAEGLPHFDNLVFRFVADGSEALDALLAGECDLLDQSAALDLPLPRLSDLQAAGQAAVLFQTGTAWELAVFGINSQDERPALFALRETRQAIALCIDRQTLASQLFSGQSQAMDSYTPSFHPLHSSEVAVYAFDPQAGAQLLESVGWLDVDGDPATPRLAQGVTGLADGTPLAFSYLVSGDAERPQSAQAIQAFLQTCGIQMEIVSGDPAQYLAPGPDGPVFGRQFDMAQFALPVSQQPPCFLFETGEIPGAYPNYLKGWGGANASGYSNPEFDAACRLARTTPVDLPQHQQAHGRAQTIFTQDLPAIPLYLRFSLIVTRPDLCGMVADPDMDNTLANLELLGYAEGCK